MYRVSEVLRITHGQDGAILLDVERGQIFTLNPVASRILQLLQSQHDPAQIAHDISETYQMNLETVKQDLGEFLQQMQGSELIEEC